jgi:hypothetical protein
MMRVLTLALLGSVLLSGCDSLPPAPGSTPEVAQTPFERDLAPKIADCFGCHTGENPEAGLNLLDMQALIGVESSQLKMALIEPGNHLQSYLWHKVAGTQSIAGGLGRQMPVNHEWPKEDIDLLARWIDLGAGI